jgi:hypothetical protein
VVLAHPELASQPLLLVMLALHDFDGNALQQHGEQLHRAELYERLLTGFARREVVRSAAAQPDPEIDRAVQVELLRLSLVAFAMFNRGRQWATEAEVDADLAALLPAPDGARSPGEQAVGRFFFVHESRAVHGDRQLRTLEFLHATFAEYLIGRLVAREAAALSGRDPEPGADALLHALLAHAPLAERAAAVSFLKELLDALPEPARVALRRLAVRHFHGSLDARAGTGLAGYRPVPLTEPARCARWSANLLLLAAMVSPVTAAELFPQAPDPVPAWRDVAMLWRGFLGRNSWNGMLQLLRTDRLGQGAARDLQVSFAADLLLVPPPIDPHWTYGLELPDRWTRVRQHDAVNLWLHADFVADRRVDLLAHALDPLWQVDPGLLEVFSHDDEGYLSSGANVLLRWFIAGATRHQDPAPPQRLRAAYLDCARFAPASPPLRELLTRQLVEDADVLPAEDVEQLRLLLTADPPGHPGPSPAAGPAPPAAARRRAAP